MTTSRSDLRKSLAERFWMKVDRQPDGCWLWTASTMEHGYGQIVGDLDEHGRRKILPAQVASWQLHVGNVPVDRTVVQTCGSQLCVRPDHLALTRRRPSLVQRKYAGSPLPEKPARCSELQWAVFVVHIQGHLSYRELATRFGLSTWRVAEAAVVAVERNLERPLPARQVEMGDQPPRVSDRNWSVYLRFSAGESSATIARDVGLSRERVRQIVNRVDELRFTDHDDSEH